MLHRTQKQVLQDDQTGGFNKNNITPEEGQKGNVGHKLAQATQLWFRSLQENEVRKVDEDESGEFIGIINYSIMALIQYDLGVVDQPDLESAKTIELYDAKVKLTKDLMENKNHDYGEAWREMRVSSLTDLILQKLLRVKQIEDNKGKTLVSEGIDANYQDMINYAVFALILMNFHK